MRFILTFALIAIAFGRTRADDYVRDKSPSPVAKAYFSTVPSGLSARKVVRRAPQRIEDGGAYYMEDGTISIPPGAMVCFKMAGRCMDPHLPAPVAGEPMQFVDKSKLIPDKLRTMYDNLIARQSQGDRKVMSNNPQHLVWAIRTAGTDDPLANNLSDSQLEVLDECAGRRGAFTKYHEKEKRRNARRNRKGRAASDGNCISVGGLSYDASELTGTGGVRCIESHISTLTEMGEKSNVRTENDFRYGEIEEELYSDISCDGGLSFTAKILNVSDHRKEFLASDFAAQVGNGSANGGMRQRVTMGTPDEIMVIEGAVAEGVEIDRSGSIAEIDGEATQRIRGHIRKTHKAKTSEGHSRTERTSEKTRRAKTVTTTVIEEVSPVPPVPPIVIHDTVTNTIVTTEEVSVRVVSLDYDTDSRMGVLTVKIVSGSFKKANAYVRKNIDFLVREQSPAGVSTGIPADAKPEIMSISIVDNDLCEVKFSAKSGK